ncbi:lysine--tRNA ligase [Actinophytocola xinjiangensis]|uniref:Lysine--tRNA ligase n=1 Tax=Actinophytocola xinjiangensis TaxID=485602 RepID=A0A7Z1ATH9_9PSEU|nr:lysine--tRNA ligase [Actinophytocola xinjiangensis]OLF04404.1 lysine--tRNA ligase [Actinophytocola xinjiangensis]
MVESGLSWVQRAADAAIEHATRRGDGRTIVCASGVSPSGPIHLGNLREVMTAHFVAEEIRSRGRDAVHLHSWDDYDRFRKVPAGLDESLAEYVGRPLAAVPDPDGVHDSYASRFIAEFSASLDRLGVRMREVRQSEQYPAGVYNAAIRQAMDRRGDVFDILASFQTEGRHDQPVEQRRAAYYPFKPYCQVCGKDFTTVTGYAGTVVEYRCRFGHTGSMSLADGERISGKLVWKVDWPMRWVHEGVDFESAGEDHHAPSSSVASGTVLIREIYGGTVPHSFPYSFVGLAGGSSKMSGSAGGAAIPATALDVLEPAIVRWLYVRRLPSQSFTIDLSPRAVQRLYDEWDQFGERAAVGESGVDAHLHEVCVRTSAGEIEHARLPVSFRLLSSAADLTQANTDQIERLVRLHLDKPDAAPGHDALLADLEPRLTCAINYATKLLTPQERTTVRTEFNQDAWNDLDEQTRAGVHLLDQHLADDWTLDGLTTLVYGVPKQLRGLPLDTPPTPELKKAQRSFFAALYRLLCSRDTGPRLPTLLLSIGQQRVHTLLGGAPTTG